MRVLIGFVYVVVLTLLASSSQGAEAIATPVPSPACEGAELATRLAKLFPPFAATERFNSARELAACPTASVEGALAAALRIEPEPAIRATLAESLGKLQRSTFIRNALANARRDPDPVVRVQADRAFMDIVAAEAAEAQALEAQRVQAAEREQEAQAALPNANAQGDEEPTLAPQIPIPPSPQLVQAPKPYPPLALPQPPIAAAPATAGPTSGVPLLLTTSLLAGSAWGAGLSVMADQDSPGVMLLLGSAGAVIGGGTAVALSRYGVRPSVEQAIWFSNVTAWGGLAGLMAYAGSGANDSRLQAGLLVGGESLGLALGAWSASRFKWRASQTAVADGIVMASALTVMGIGRWDGKSDGIPAWMGYGTAPLMVGAAVLAQQLSLSKNDLRFMTLTSAASSLTLGLVASGLEGSSLLGNHQGQGGLVAGLGMGLLAGTLASPWVEPTPKQLKLASAGWLAGAAFGMGSFMVAFPQQADAEHKNLGTAVGAATFAAAGYWLAPRLRVGPGVVPLSLTSAAVAAGLWGLAGSAAGDVLTNDQRSGGALALAVSGGLAGAWASSHFRPTVADYVTTVAATLAGASGGLGVARLASSQNGGADFAGVLAGGALGLSLGAWTNHERSVRTPEVWAGSAGAVYGLMLANNLRNFAHAEEQNDRIEDGAKYLGLSLGMLAGASAARLTHATTGQVFVPTVAMSLGLLIGDGAGDLAGGAQGARIGATAAGVGLAATSLLLDRKLKWSQGVGKSWAPNILWGGMLGGFQGILLADLARHARNDGTHDRRRGSGFIAGAAAGVAAGLVLSQVADPNANDYVLTAMGSLTGLSLGVGVAGLSNATASEASALRLGGSIAGLISAATVAHFIKPTAVDLLAESLGAGYGFALGALVTSLDHTPGWSYQQTTGGTLGLALGATGAVAVTHALGASAAKVTTATTGTILTTMAGTGLGMAFPGEGSHSTRVGATLGLSLGLAGTLVADHWIGFSRTPLGPRMKLALAGSAFGAYQGILFGRALSYDVENGSDRARQRGGGLMFGAAAGSVAGLLLSNALAPSGVDILVTGTGSALGSAFGAGAAWLVTSEAGVQDTWATLGGSMAGLMAAGAMQRHAPLTGADAAASGVGFALGALAGGLAPSLHLDSVTNSDRVTYGGLMVGAAAGAALGVATRKATDAETRTVGMAAWAGLHGAVTGLSAGALIDGAETTQALRIGALAGGLGGAAIGATLWKHATFASEADKQTVAAATTWGAWSGWWTSRLLRDRDPTGDNGSAGVIAGAGVGSMLAISASPFIDVSTDVLVDALAMNVLLGGFAGGVAAMATTHEDATPAAVLAGGSAGLLLGGILHERIHLAQQSMPLLSVAIAQGTFTGIMLPTLLQRQSRRDEQGAMAIGTLGGASVGLLLSSVVKPTATTAALAGLGSATGAAIGGGMGLVADDIGAQGGAALTLAASALGLTAGALAGRSNPSAKTILTAAAAGSALGAAEGAVFSWAARGTSRDDYAGSMLVGAGLGTTLALASAASETWQIPASAGFGAWGAWIGSFSGALIQRSPQEVTLGGLIGLNVGVAAGYGALTANWIEPSDFGWLSLFGAAGTLVGGSTGALLSTSENPEPAFVGLAVGPIAGLAVGALMLPTWRRLRGPETKTENENASSSLAALSSTLGAAAPPRGAVAEWTHRTKRKLSALIEVGDVMPLVGAMPSNDQSGTPPPFVMGLTGKWR